MTQKLTTKEIVDNFINSQEILPSEKMELLSATEEQEKIEIVKKIAERWGLSIIESPENVEQREREFKNKIIYGE